VRDGYHKLAQREPERFRIIDADQIIDEVASNVWNAVKEVLL